MDGPADRLDSWKAIGAYLGRDARTLRRWEAAGLPVRRIKGERGYSVFAFKSEIDIWLKARGTDAAPKPPDPVEDPRDVPRAPTPPRTAARWRVMVASLLMIVIAVGWRAMAPSAALQNVNVHVTSTAVVATDERGAERWRFDYPPDVIAEAPIGASEQTVGGQSPAIFAMSSYLLQRPDDVMLAGVLREFSLDGRLRQSVSLSDRWTFAGRVYGAPWVLTDFRADDAFGRRRIALAAHHSTWWPSVVTILDDRFQREGTFVNAGWVERVRWLSPDRLAISGFNQRLDGGMFAVLDTDDISGALPEPAHSPFACDACGGATPVFYAVFPRSELNRVTASPFNRAMIEVSPQGIVAHTFEMNDSNEPGLTEAIYEFSPSLELLHATYGDRYWDRHRAAELEGKIAHTREACPERGGPPFVWIWTRDRGWTKVVPKR